MDDERLARIERRVAELERQLARIEWEALERRVRLAPPPREEEDPEVWEP